MRKLNLLLTVVALSLATSQLWADKPYVDNGKLPGAFTINSNCDMVYFSQGNLQYIGSAATPYWQFASAQYETLGDAQYSAATNVDRDLLGWGTSGYHDTNDAGNMYYQPWATSNTSNVHANNYWGYGPSSDVVPDGHSWSEYEATKHYDWGVHNPIANGGNKAGLWRVLTYEEWRWVIGATNGSGSPGSDCRFTYNTINGTAQARYTRAMVNGIFGVIIFPDLYTGGTPSGVTWGRINVCDNNSNYTTCTIDGWNALEAAGCVFLPATRRRSGTSHDSNGAFYQSSTSRSSFQLCGVYIKDYLNVSNSCASKQEGGYVRLVQDVPDDVALDLRPQASVATPPTAVASLVYNGSSKTLVNAAGTATGGTVKYKLSTQGEGSWSTTRPSAINAGEYTVQWFVEASGCYLNSDVEEIHVTIKRASTSAPSPMPTIEAATLTYNGSAQDLVTTTGSIQSGYTTVYSTDGVNWSTTIPQGTNAGDYTVYYKFYKGDNYEYVPSPNTIEVNIDKAYLPGVTLPEATSTIPYDGTEKTLLEIDPVANATIWYKLGSGEWTTTPPTRTDAGDYSVQYKIVPDDEVNYNTIGQNTVTVTILDYPTVYDNADPTTKLTELLNTPSDLKVKRTIYADDEYNTICLPFALDESALAASPLAGFNRLKTFKGAQVTGTAPDLYIDIFVEDATTIEAGIPYLITYPAAHADIVDPVFNSITVTTTTPSATSADGVTFQGMFAQVHIDPYDAGHTQDYLFVGANSQLYWPSSDQTSSLIKMRGFRAYFIIDRNSISPALAPKGTRARIMDAPKTTTAIDNTSAKFGGSEKIIENGILYIIRNGVKYNAQGQIVK